MLSSPGGMAVLTTLVSGWIINAANVPRKKILFGILRLRQLVALASGIVIVVGSHYAGQGFAAELSGFDLYSWAVGVGLIANGVANVDLWRNKAMKLLRAVNDRD